MRSAPDIAHPGAVRNFLFGDSIRNPNGMDAESDRLRLDGEVELIDSPGFS